MVKEFVISKLKNQVLINSAIVFAGSMLGNFAAYLYHLILGRILGPVGYGELASLISILYIIGVPTVVIQTVLVKLFSKYKAENNPGKAHTLFNKMTRYIFILLVAVSFVLVFMSPFIKSFLHLSSWTLVIWLALVFIFSTLSIINASVLQGFQKFIMVGIFAVLPIFIKLIISVPLSYGGVEWAMIAASVATIIAYAVYMLPVRFLLKKEKQKIELTKRQVLLFSIPTLFTVLGTTSIYSTDIILAKHFLSPIEAGIYSAVAVLGKIIFFASSAINLVTFPIISERTEKKVKASSIIFSSMAGVLAVSTVLTGMYFFIPSLIVGILFGKSFLSAVPYMGYFGIFISLFALGQLMTMICLAMNKTKISLIAITAALAQIILITLFHTTIMQIININIVTGVLFVVSAGLYLFVSGPVKSV